MATALEIISTVLLANTGVTAIVEQRIYPVLAPQGAELPNIVITLVSDNDDQMLAGAAQLPESRVSVISRGRTATEMMDLADAVKLVLRDIIHQSIGTDPLSADVCIWKAGTDFTSAFDDPLCFEQTTDYLIRWRE